ncbi:MAG: FKBP-type peptidyl-prolyl cis-trans isomerase [Acidobacteriota bacterium]|nr:FKBP-type peptidyl-prolyl cis-trans isomerase [Acidobacteriota bacterium]
MKILTRALLLMLAAAAVACDNGSPTSPLVFVGPANLVSTDVRVGTGAVVSAGQQVTVHYGLWLYDPNGTDLKGRLVQDSRMVAGAQPVTFALRPESIIQGWVDGVPGMRVGGVRRLIIPPSLAYGAAGSGSAIPPNAWLVFDIEMFGVAQ